MSPLGKSIVDVHKFQSWTKSLLEALADFTFVHLVNSKEKMLKQ